MSSYHLRQARTSDLPLLQEIEQVAAQRFCASHLPVIAELAAAPPLPLDLLRAHQRQGQVDVVALPDETPVGFALVRLIDGAVHLHELDVRPEHGRRGLGTRLLEHVCRRAASQGYPAVTLTTFRAVPWNAPFYARHGFRVLHEAELTPGLRAVLEEEAANGLPREERVCMRRELRSLGG